MATQSCSNCTYLLRDNERNLNACNAFHNLDGIADLTSHNCNEWEVDENSPSPIPLIGNNIDLQNPFRRWRRTPEETERLRSDFVSMQDRVIWRRFADEYEIRPTANQEALHRLEGEQYCHSILNKIEAQSTEIQRRFNVKPSYILISPATWTNLRKRIAFSSSIAVLNEFINHRTINGLRVITSPHVPDNEVEVAISSKELT